MIGSLVRITQTAPGWPDLIGATGTVIAVDGLAARVQLTAAVYWPTLDVPRAWLEPVTGGALTAREARAMARGEEARAA